MSESSHDLNIIIAGPYPALNTGIKHIIYHCCGKGHIQMAGSLGEVTEHLREMTCNILFMDDAIAGLDEHARKTIIRVYPCLKVIVLTMSDDKEYIRSLFSSGVAGCMHKTAQEHEYRQAIRDVMQNKRFHCASVTCLLINEKAELPPAEGSVAAKAGLTKREEEILPFLIKKAQEKSIAGTLHVSLSTISTHRKNIRKKLAAVKLLYIVDDTI